jgi:hypothetical protein
MQKGVIADLFDEEIRHVGARDEPAFPVARIDRRAIGVRLRPTLEWTLPSPPPFHQFDTLPRIVGPSLDSSGLESPSPSIESPSLEPRPTPDHRPQTYKPLRN